VIVPPPDLLQQASTWLENQRQRFLTQTIAYQRAGASVEIAATCGETIFRLDDGAGALLRIQTRDFLIAAVDLVLGGNPIVPQRGDRIVETQGSRTFIYEVSAPGDEPEWRWSDPYRQTYRIHTQEVDTQ
jgi:hypothetical protein